MRQLAQSGHVSKDRVTQSTLQERAVSALVRKSSAARSIRLGGSVVLVTSLIIACILGHAVIY
jgi:hypothetical protein